MKVKDLLFYVEAGVSIHSGWMQYNDIRTKDNKIGTMAEILKSYGGKDDWTCWNNYGAPGRNRNQGFKRHAGSWDSSPGKLCNSDLYFSPGDQDGNSNHCGQPDNGGLGPAWSAGDNNGCPMDDPG